jgi:hypothetical protein
VTIEKDKDNSALEKKGIIIPSIVPSSIYLCSIFTILL